MTLKSITTSPDRIALVEAECHGILKSRPYDLAALRRLKMCQWLASDFEAIIETSSRILESDPADADALYSRALARLALTDIEGCLQDLDLAESATTDMRMKATLAEARSSAEHAREIREGRFA
ncbi:MAG: hypothetical protein MH204_04735 [Fimbriimonadaceae bacterium]|nr:hypothetical protein [Fimbriimonadaceae bacterium]